MLNPTRNLLAADEEATGCVVEDSLTGDGGLRFQLRPDYRPDVSVKAQQRLTRATLGFLHDAHPQNMTLALWNKNPRDLPHLGRHIAATVRAVYVGVEIQLPKQPVDPVLIISLLYNESRFSPVAISPSGAAGMAQFMPNTAMEYGLNPIAQMELWQRYRDVRTVERARRSQQRDEFLKQFGLHDFSTAAVIEHTLETENLDALAAYQQLVAVEKPEHKALEDYIAALREEFSQHDFFADGEQSLGRLDARVGYGAIAAAVEYIARRLIENSGMTSSAISAYNAGPASVQDRNPQSVLYGYGDLPANPETVRYLQRVMVVYSKLRDRLV